MADRVWISWNLQRRNVGLAEAVRARLYMTERGLPGWLRLIREFYYSWKIIQRERPKICFTMNPSIFSSWWLSILAGIYKFNLVTDLHTPNIKLTGLKKMLFNMIFNAGIRRSDVVIVTNNIYRETILKLNRNVVIVPDALPVIKEYKKNMNGHLRFKNRKMNILCVSSFDDDEPVEEILALDHELNEFDILVTGNWKKKYEVHPDTRNIRFSGFVSEEEYKNILLSADGVLVLTNSEGCLCCGAYEAFSAGKPLILSNTKALKEFFGNAPIYADNFSASILSAFKQLKREKEERQMMIVNGRQELNMKFSKSIEELSKFLYKL